MKITIICVGTIKEKVYRDAVAEYAKRLSKYCRLEIIEVQDEKTPDHALSALEEQIKEKEASRILKHIKEDAFDIYGFYEQKEKGVISEEEYNEIVNGK